MTDSVARLTLRARPEYTKAAALEVVQPLVRELASGHDFGND
jgi:hypothetical protein